MVKGREAWCAAVHGGLKESDTTEWTEPNRSRFQLQVQKELEKMQLNAE